MRVAKSSIGARSRTIPELKFEDQQLSSFGGLVVFQKLFEVLDLARHLKGCCGGLERRSGRFYSHGKLLECLIVHLLLGYRKLRDMDFYRDDPLVLQVLGLKRLPSVPTVSRMLREFDEASVAAQRDLNRSLVLSRLRDENFKRVTLDFDGSVQSTTRHAEGTAVGFNKKKKGARSYYPLLCTVAQTGQVFARVYQGRLERGKESQAGALTKGLRAARDGQGDLVEIRDIVNAVGPGQHGFAGVGHHLGRYPVVL